MREEERANLAAIFEHVLSVCVCGGHKCESFVLTSFGYGCGGTHIFEFLDTNLIYNTYDSLLFYIMDIIIVIFHFIAS